MDIVDFLTVVTYSVSMVGIGIKIGIYIKRK